MAQDNPSTPDQINLVGEGTVFEGTLRAESDVRANGRILGRLEVDGKAIVAKSGTVEGEIVATHADIAGHVQGEIRIEDQLVLKSTAHIDGDIATGRLVVEEGAVFTGACSMGEARDREESAPTHADASDESAATAPSAEQPQPSSAATADETPVAPSP